MRRGWSGAPWVAVVLLAIAAGAWLWEEDLKDRLIPRNFGVVEEGRIYRSGQLNHALIKRVLKEHGIDLVISLNSEGPDDPDEAAEQAAVRELGIARRFYPGLRGDGTGPVQSYIEGLSSLLEARRDGKTVLVHCGAGAYRTGALIAWYRTLVQGLSPQTAYDEMLTYGVRPSKASALLAYMNEHTPEVAKALQRRGLIARVPDRLPVFPVPQEQGANGYERSRSAGVGRPGEAWRLPWNFEGEGV